MWQGVTRKITELKKRRKSWIQGNLYVTAKTGQRCTTGFLTTIPGAESETKYYAIADACIACPATTANSGTVGVTGQKGLILQEKLYFIWFKSYFLKDFLLSLGKRSDTGKFWLSSKFKKFFISPESFSPDFSNIFWAHEFDVGHKNWIKCFLMGP